MFYGVSAGSQGKKEGENKSVMVLKTDFSLLLKEKGTPKIGTKIACNHFRKGHLLDVIDVSFLSP